MDKIASQVYWEKNGLVNTNPNINPNNVIARTKTVKFPYDAVTVRINNQTRGIVTVYFRDELKTRTFGSGNHKQSYDYCQAEAKITLPMFSRWNNMPIPHNYALQGQIPRKYSLTQFSEILDYVRETVEDMTGNKVKEIPYASK